MFCSCLCVTYSSRPLSLFLGGFLWLWREPNRTVARPSDLFSFSLNGFPLLFEGPYFGLIEYIYHILYPSRPCGLGVFL